MGLNIKKHQMFVFTYTINQIENKVLNHQLMLALTCTANKAEHKKSPLNAGVRIFQE